MEQYELRGSVAWRDRKTGRNIINLSTIRRNKQVSREYIIGRKGSGIAAMYPDIINEIPKVSTAETLDIIAKAKDRIEKDMAVGKKQKDNDRWMQ